MRVDGEDEVGRERVDRFQLQEPLDEVALGEIAEVILGGQLETQAARADCPVEKRLPLREVAAEEGAEPYRRADAPGAEAGRLGLDAETVEAVLPGRDHHSVGDLEGLVQALEFGRPIGLQMLARAGGDVERGKEDAPALGGAVDAVHAAGEALEEELAHPGERTVPAGARLIGDASVVLARPGPREEAEGRIERRAEFVDLEGEVPEVVGIGDAGPPSRGASLRQVAGAVRPPGGEDEVLVALEGGGLPDSVEAAEGVLSSSRGIAPGADGAQAQVRVHIVGDAAGEEVDGRRRPGVAGLHVESGDRPASGAAEDLEAGVEGHHLSFHQTDPP